MVADEKSSTYPDPESLDKGTDPRIRMRIRTKMSRIRNTSFFMMKDINAFKKGKLNCETGKNSLVFQNNPLN